MATPVVVVNSGGIPITLVDSGGAPMTVADNGYGIGVTIVASGGLPVGLAGYYDQASIALFGAMTTQPNGPRKTLIDTTIKALKTAGVWSQLDVLHTLASADAQSARLNWISPGTFTLSSVNSPVFQTDRGYTGDGSTSYLSSTFQPGISGAATQNDASIGSWALTNADGVLTDIGNTTSHVRANNTSQEQGRVMSAVGPQSVAISTAIGLSVLCRADASNVRLYKNGSLQVSTAVASTAPAAFPMYVLARNSSGTPIENSPRQVAIAFAGRNLTDAQNASLYSSLLPYLQSVGAA